MTAASAPGEPGAPEPGSSSSDVELPRLAGYAVLAFSALLPVVELGRLGLYVPRHELWIALAGGWLLLDPYWVANQWVNSPPFVCAAVALLVRGPARVIALVLPSAAVVASGLVDPPPGDPLLTMIWVVAHSVTIGVMLTGALFGSVRLIQVVGELYETRYSLATEAVASERLRVSRDRLRVMTGEDDQ